MSMLSWAVNRPPLQATTLRSALRRVAPRIAAAGLRGIPRAAIVACIYEHLELDDVDAAQTHETIRRFVDAVLDGPYG